MKIRYKQSGRTLMEMTVVIAAIVLLGSFGLPAIRAFLDSFESGAAPKSVISAALASARAIAAKEQRYAGIRFQKAFHPDGPLEASQYMILIVHDVSKTGLASGFRAVEGLEPIKLPDSLGVMDLKRRTNPNPMYSGYDPIDTDVEISDLNILRDTTAFSIIFSPSGKLVIHDVRVRNRDGDYQPLNLADSMDDIFNSPENITNFNTGMFVQDDYASMGLGQEVSRRSFVIYDRLKFRRAYEKGQAYSAYLQNLPPEAIIDINPYTGTMIEK
jgi:hypothetical protein